MGCREKRYAAGRAVRLRMIVASLPVLIGWPTDSMARKAHGVGSLVLAWSLGGERTIHRPSADGTVILVTAILAFIGLVMVFSASGVVAGNRFHDSVYFLKRQIAWLAFGLLLMQGASRIDYRVWRKFALPILAITIVLLVLVLIPGVGSAAKGARRWLRLGPVSIQPAELIKLVAVLYLASYLTNKGERLKDFSRGFLPQLAAEAGNRA